MLKVDQLQGDVKPKHPWKIYALTAFAVLSLIFVNAWSPAKNALYDLGVKIHSFGILGPLLFLLFNGLIIIPLALPYIVFEMVIALIIPDFIYSVSFSLLGKMLGAGVSYIVTKYTLKQKIRNSFKDMKAFKGIEHVLQKDPIKFSLILRIVTIPLFLKNYGLAVPDNVTFRLYMLCTFIATIPTTAMNIYLFQETGNLANAFSADKSWLHKTFSIAMITVSVLLMVYVVRYTKKLIKELEKLSYDEIKMTEKPAHIELEIISTLDINMKNIEIVNTEEGVALHDESPVDGKMELYLNKLAL